MKKILLVLTLIALQLDGYMAMPSGTSSSAPSTTTPTKPAPKPRYTKPQMLPRPQHKDALVQRPGLQIPMGRLFYHPGMVWLQNGHWLGADNFTNISKNMALQVDLVKAAEITSPVTEEAIRNKIATVFAQSGIAIIQGAGEGSIPPLPLFEMQVMVFPVKDGFAGACFSHLFEDAPPKRLKLGEGEVFQSITWQQANLVVSPSDGFEKLLLETVEAIANNFVKRLATYQAPAKSQAEVPAYEPFPSSN